MKSLKERFETSYAAVLVKKGDKEKVKYVYFAPWFVWDSPGNRLSADKNKVLLTYIAGLITFLAFSTRACEANALPWVDLFVALSICARIFELIAVIRFKTAEEKTTQMTFESVNMTLRIAPVLDTVFMITAAVLGLFLSKREIAAGMTILVSCGYLLCAVQSFLLYKFYAKLTFHTEKNDSLKHYEH